MVTAGAMVKMLEVAWYPVKQSKETFSLIQLEMKYEPTKEMKQEIWSGGLYAVGVPLPQGITSPEYFKSLRSHWIHNHGIGAAQVMILLTIMVAKFVWERRGGGNVFWFCANWVAMFWIGAGILGGNLMPDVTGLSQRVMYCGIYFWMLIVVRQIERLKSLEIKAEFQIPGISAPERQDAAVTDTPLQA